MSYLNVLCGVRQLLINEHKNDQKTAFEDDAGLSPLEYFFQRFGHDSYPNPNFVLGKLNA